MGACQVSSGGYLSVDLDPDTRLGPQRSCVRKNILDTFGATKYGWQLSTQTTENTRWQDVVESLNTQHGLGSTPVTSSIHIHFRTHEDWSETPSDLQVTVWNGRAVLSDFLLEFEDEPEKISTLIDASIEVASCAVALQQALVQQGLIRSTPATDRWLTLSVRVDGVPPEAAVDMFSSEFGPTTATSLPDGSGSLLRVRVPLEDTPPELLRLLHHPCSEPDTLIPDGWMSISPVPVEICDGLVVDTAPKLPFTAGFANVVILGAGGLGSWAAPLFCEGVWQCEMTLIDGDDSVDEHNLNRQVLYTDSDVGLPKATQAANRLRDIQSWRRLNNGWKPIPAQIQSFNGIHSRLESNHVFEAEEVEGIETVSLDSLFDDGPDTSSAEIKAALDEMDVGLACLDNMNSRTLFNRACIDRRAIFVNGGGEAFEGLVEILDSDVCMTCRYGEDSARSREVISCQEVGTRPVASIVTTTAWTGAMQAAIALLALAEQRGKIDGNWHKGLDFNMGMVQPRIIGRLPWFQGDCKSHA
jgi:molybdopterin/thiamine biosynthesis adenylyltransferase